MKILNLYAGIGGNRKYWVGDVTAVEYTKEIADVYQENYPGDTVVVADAHQYLLEHYHEFDFIWSSPPCQSHSKMQISGRNRTPRYPDMKLYEEVLFLQQYHKGKWVVENVVPYYEPMLNPQRIGRHLFWANFIIRPFDHSQPSGFIKTGTVSGKKELLDWLGLKCEKNIYYEGNHDPCQVLRNCVHPDVGSHIFNEAAWIGDLFPDER